MFCRLYDWMCIDGDDDYGETISKLCVSPLDDFVRRRTRKEKDKDEKVERQEK